MIQFGKHNAGFYDLPSRSLVPRVVLAGLAALWVAMAWWLLLGGGLTVAGHWVGLAWESGNLARRVLLVAALSIYYVRVLFTIFVFLQRGMSWREVFTIVPWLLFIYLLLAIAGGTDAEALGVVGGVGLFLFVDGFWISSYAEYTRYMWKRRKENHGQLYTEGLFKRTRHPNYLGDLVSFSGLCLISGAWVTAIIPLIMLMGFLFVNIPILDSHLHDHYGATFDEYAKHTRKLLPFVY